MKRRKPIKRSATPIARKSRPKATNAYMRPEWRKLCREVKKRSRGICESQVCCDGDVATGDPHHTEYQEGMVGWQRLIVPLDKLVAVCRRCHLALEQQKLDKGFTEVVDFVRDKAFEEIRRTWRKDEA